MLFKNTSANFVGKILPIILSILLTPFYIYYLGLEGYGLIGFFITLTMLLQIFTKGLGQALKREFARRDVYAEDQRTLRRLVRTFELIYGGIGLLLGVVLLGFSGFISTDWLHVTTISEADVRLCLMLIAIQIATTFPNSVYSGVLVGTQRQVLQNSVSITLTIITSIASVIVVFMWQSVVFFYLVNTLFACVGIGIVRYYALRGLPAKADSEPPRFHWPDIKQIGGLAGGLMWVHAIGLVIVQLDRIFISALLPLAALGVYTASAAGGRLMLMSCSPYNTASYPQLCQAARQSKPRLLQTQIIRNTKVIAIISLAIGLPIAFFAEEILTVWTRNEEVVRDGAGVMALYVFGNIFNNSAGVLYQAQTALGKVKYNVWFNSVAALWFPAVLWFMIQSMGLSGAALAWVVYGLASWLYHMVITLGILLSGKNLRAYFQPLALTVAVSVAIMVGTHWLAEVSFPTSDLGQLFIAAIGAGITLVACYVLNFGWHIPHELQPLARKVGLLRKPSGGQA
jgi:O-antigen/teichoic acid export membrane protein